MASKRSAVGHEAIRPPGFIVNQVLLPALYPKQTEGETKKKERGVIYQCKVNNFHLNLTKNRYFITKLLAGMKKDWGSWGGCGGKEESEGSMEKTG